MPSPLMMSSIDAAVDHVLDITDGDIVLGIPLGIGKPNPFVNALYERIKANPARRMRIITALSLEKPVGKSELEQSFLGPLVDRVFADYPDLEYVKDLRGSGMPPNIEICEVFMKTGDYLGNAVAQQNYMSSNYTHIARDMVAQGMNVMAQAVASREASGGLTLSLSSNPDVVMEVLDMFRASGKKLTAVGVINHQMPFMPNTAVVNPDFFDVLVTDPKATHTLFAPPNNKVGLADYAIGLHASSLVSDGGTLQIGIGSLGDAIGQALIQRERQNLDYRQMLEDLCPDGLDGRELGHFDEGLYGCSEMFVNGFLKLIEAGIVRREVYGDVVLQQLLNHGVIDNTLVTPQTLRALLDTGRVRSPLAVEDLAFLQRFGIVRAGVSVEGEELVLGEQRCSANLLDEPTFACVCENMLGAHLRGGISMTGGFFIGPRDFYERLRSMPAQELAQNRHDAHRFHQPALRSGRPQAGPAAQGPLHEHHHDRHPAGCGRQRCAGVRPGGQRCGRAVQLCGHVARAARCTVDHDAARHPRQQGRPEEQHCLELRPCDHSAPPARHGHHRIRRGRPARPEPTARWSSA